MAIYNIGVNMIGIKFSLAELEIMIEVLERTPHNNSVENKLREDLRNILKNIEDENPDYQSSCCSSSPFGNSFDEEELTGICSKCYDGANFNDLNDEGE